MSMIDIDSILELSCLSITDDRKQEFSDQLDSVLDYMSVLNKVDKIPNPAYEWPIQKEMVDREDISQLFQHDLVQENAPEYKPGGFSVPRIIS